MDLQTIDQTYSQLQAESQRTVQALTALASKLQAAAQSVIPTRGNGCST